MGSGRVEVLVLAASWQHKVPAGRRGGLVEVIRAEDRREHRDGARRVNESRPLELLVEDGNGAASVREAASVRVHAVGLAAAHLQRIASHRIAQHRTASRRVASRRVASRRMASCRIASHRVASRRNVSRRIAPHRIASSVITNECTVRGGAGGGLGGLPEETNFANAQPGGPAPTR